MDWTQAIYVNWTYSFIFLHSQIYSVSTPELEQDLTKQTPLKKERFIFTTAHLNNLWMILWFLMRWQTLDYIYFDCLGVQANEIPVSIALKQIELGSVMSRFDRKLRCWMQGTAVLLFILWLLRAMALILTKFLFY